MSDFTEMENNGMSEITENTVGTETVATAKPNQIEYSQTAYTALMNHLSGDKYQLLLDVKDGKKSKEDLREEAEKFLDEYGDGLDIDLNDEKKVNQLIDVVFDNILGYGILTDIIEDDTVSDINILNFDRIILKRKGKRVVSDIKFASAEAFQRFVDGICTRNRINTSTRHATSRFTDNRTSERAILRFSLVTPFLTSDKEYKIYIRKTLKDFPEVEDLIKEGMMTERVAKKIEKNFNEASTLFCGGVSSGKTTILNAMKERIAKDKMVLVIQQAEELTTKTHPMMTFLHSVEGSMESDVRYDLEELSTLGLTLDTDYFVIGEIKGAETTHLLKCSNTGCIATGTIHANTPEEALDRVIDFSLHAEGNAYTKSELVDMLASFRTMIFMKNFKVERISELESVIDGKMKFKCVYDRTKGIDLLDDELIEVKRG